MTTGDVAQPVESQSLPAPRDHQQGPTYELSVPMSPHEAADILVRAFGGNVAGLLSSGIGGIGVGLESAEPRAPHRTDGYVAACVNLLCTAFAGATGRWYDRDPDEPGAKQVTGTPLNALFGRINPLLHAALFRMTIAQDIRLSGECFLFLTDRLGMPVQTYGSGPEALIEVPDEIWPVRGDLVRMADDDGGLPLVWEVPIAGSGMRQHFPAGAVTQIIEKPDPDRIGRGIGRIAEAWGPITERHLARRYNRANLRRGGRPDAILALKGFLSPAQRRLLQSEVNDEWGGPDNVGGTRVLGGDAKYQPMMQSAKDMEFAAALNMGIEELCAVMSTPRVLLGGVDANFATAKQHAMGWIHHTVKPFLLLVASCINERFAARLKDSRLRGMRLRYDTTDLERAVRDYKELGDSLRALQDAGMPYDDALAQAGVQGRPVPAGDVSFVQAGLVPRHLAVLDAQAKAALNLQLAGADPEAAMKEVGLEHLPLIEIEDPPEPEPDAGEDEADGEDGQDDDEESPPPPPPAKGKGAKGKPADDEKKSQGDDARRPSAAVLDRILRGKRTGHLRRRFGLPAPARARTVEHLRSPRFNGGGIVPLRAPITLDLGSDALVPKIVRIEDLLPIKPTRPWPRTAVADQRAGKKYAKPGERVRAWRKAQLAERPMRIKLGARYVRWIRDGLNITLRAFDEYVKNGTVDRDKLLRTRVAGVTDELLALRHEPAGRTAVLSRHEAGALLAAWTADRQEAARLAREAPEKLTRTLVLCDGTERREPIEWTPRQDAWRSRRAWAAGHDRVLLVQCALATVRADFTEDQLNELVVIADRRFAAAMAEGMSPLLADSWLAGSKDLRSLLNLSSIKSPPPFVARQMRDKAIAVTEGLQSTVARRLREDILKVLADAGGTGPLRDQIEASLKELKATTTKAFRTHAQRSKVIAQTEIAGAASSGRYDECLDAEQRGLSDGTYWSTSGLPAESQGGPTRNWHYAMDGQRRKLSEGEKFLSGKGTLLERPLAAGAPADEVIQCKCKLLPDVE